MSNDKIFNKIPSILIILSIALYGFAIIKSKHKTQSNLKDNKVEYLDKSVN